jgi:hypothetical protein
MKNIQKALAVGILAISSSYAMAAPTFSFTEVAGFEIGDVDIASYGAALPAGTPANTTPEGGTVSASMNWYDTSTTKSTLTLTSFGGALPSGDEVWTTITRLTHANNPITSNPLHGWGEPQDILGRLIIDDEGGELLDDENVIQITLEETLNQAPCSIPNPTGSAVPCDDFFTFTAIGLASLDFTASDGSLWTANFRLANFVNSAQTLDGIYTAEGLVSSLDVQIELVERVVEVPEPATLGIFGLGLLGLGIAKRRKQKA